MGFFSAISNAWKAYCEACQERARNMPRDRHGNVVFLRLTCHLVSQNPQQDIEMLVL